MRFFMRCGVHASCGGKQTDDATTAADTAETEAGEPAAKDSYKFAVIKQLDHASLDEIANAVKAQLEKLGEEKGVTVEVEIDDVPKAKYVSDVITMPVIEEIPERILTAYRMASESTGRTVRSAFGRREE